MNRTGSYDATSKDRTRERREKNMAANTTEYYTMNAIATLLALAALAMFVVGMLIGTGIIDTSSTTAVTTGGGGDFDGTNFAHGTVWLLGAISTALAANVFRRAHSTVDPTEFENRGAYSER